MISKGDEVQLISDDFYTLCVILSGSTSIIIEQSKKVTN